MEGLACRFEEEIGGRAPIYANHLSDDERQLWVSQSKSELLDENYSHQDWFFGSKEKQVPKWIGYDLGYYLIGLYLKETGKTASECYDTPSDAILELLTRKGYV